jgi:hypothetical protein
MGAERRHARAVSDDARLDDNASAALAEQRATGSPGRDTPTADRGPGRLIDTAARAEAGEFLYCEYIRHE